MINGTGRNSKERRFHEHPTRPNEDDQDAADRRTAIRASPPDDGMASIGNKLDAAHSCAEQYDLPVVESIPTSTATVPSSS